MVISMKWLFFWCSCCIFSATASENPRRQVHFNPQLSVREFKKKNPVNGEFQRLQVPMPVERDLEEGFSGDGAGHVHDGDQSDQNQPAYQTPYIPVILEPVPMQIRTGTRPKEERCVHCLLGTVVVGAIVSGIFSLIKYHV